MKNRFYRIKNKVYDRLNNTAKIIDPIQKLFENTTLNRLSIKQKLNKLNGIFKKKSPELMSHSKMTD